MGNNNERFNQLLNSCANPRRTYNALMAFVEPCHQQADNVLEERKVIIGQVFTFLDKADRHQKSD